MYNASVKEQPAREDRDGNHFDSCKRVSAANVPDQEVEVQSHIYNEIYMVNIVPPEFGERIRRRNKWDRWVRAMQFYLSHLATMHGGDDKSNCRGYGKREKR